MIDIEKRGFELEAKKAILRCKEYGKVKFDVAVNFTQPEITFEVKDISKGNEGDVNRLLIVHEQEIIEKQNFAYGYLL